MRSDIGYAPLQNMTLMPFARHGKMKSVCVRPCSPFIASKTYDPFKLIWRPGALRGAIVGTKMCSRKWGVKLNQPIS